MSASSLQAHVQKAGERFGGNVAQFFVPSGDPDGPAQEVSFALIADDVRRRASALAALGISRRDHVSMMTPLGPHGLSTLMGAMIAATAAPLNYFLEAPTLTRLVEAAGSVALVVARRFADEPGAPAKAAAIRAALPHLKLIAYGEGPEIEGALDLDAAARVAEGGWREEHRQTSPDRVLALFHTGGTTGRPKLVPHTEAMYGAMLAVSAGPMGVTEGNRILGGLPLFHTSGALQAGIVPTLSGCGVVIPSPAGFRASGLVANYWAFVRRFGVTVGGSVPTILNALAGVAAYQPLPNLKHILCGGAPLPISTIEAISQRSGGAAVLEGWGMTETCGFSVLNPTQDRRTGSVGLPFKGVELQVRRAVAGGERLPPDTVGELVVRGDIVIRNYHDDRPDSFTEDGWLRTGDLARIDGDDYVYIVGRAKDLIIRGGHNIDPALIENPAYEHPAIELAAAVGRPDRHAGELPILFVQLRPGMSATPEEILAFVAERIQERAATPKAVHIVDIMPLSGPGKVSKVPLRHEAARAVMQADVDALDGTRVAVSIVEDGTHGAVVRVRGADAACRAAAVALAGYTYRIVEEHTA